MHPSLCVSPAHFLYHFLHWRQNPRPPRISLTPVFDPTLFSSFYLRPLFLFIRSDSALSFITSIYETAEGGYLLVASTTCAVVILTHIPVSLFYLDALLRILRIYHSTYGSSNDNHHLEMFSLVTWFEVLTVTCGSSFDRVFVAIRSQWKSEAHTEAKFRRSFRWRGIRSSSSSDSNSGVHGF